VTDVEDVSQRTDIPPANAPNFGDKVREALSTYLGKRGDPMDRGVTLRDLLTAGMINLSDGYKNDPASFLPISGPGQAIEDLTNTYVVDLTPPPTPTGFAASAGLTTVIVQTNAPVYTAGNGHSKTRLYGVTYAGGDQPTFLETYLIAEFTGPIFSFPATLGSEWRLWVKWVSNDGVASVTPAGGVNGLAATTGKIGNADLNDLIITAGKLADGSVSGTKLAALAIDATKFAAGIEPVGIVSSVPGAKSTTTIVNTVDGKLYRWNGAAYVATVPTTDLSGTISDAQIAAIAASKVTGTLSDSQLAAIGAAKITGQITSTQITDNSITTAKIAAGAVTASQIAADTITASQIAAGAITASELAAGSVVAGKIAAGSIQAVDIAAGAVTTSKLLVVGNGSALNLDPNCSDQTAWTGWDGHSPATVTTITDGQTGSTCLRVTTGFSRSISSKLMPCDRNKTYRITALVRQNGNGVLYLRTVQYGATDTSPSGGVEYTYDVEAVNPPTGVWTRYSATFQPDIGRAFFSPHILLAWGATTGYMDAQDIRIEEVIPGSLIVDGAITAAKIAANTITAGQIAAGAISATQIAAGAISTDKLLVTGRGKALNDDPACSDATAWSIASAGAIGIISGATDSPVGISYIRATGATNFMSRTFPVENGKRYKISYWARQISGSSLSYGRIYCYNGTPALLQFECAQISPGTGTLEGITLPSSWTKYVGYIDTIPGAAVARILMHFNWDTGGVSDVTDLRCEEYIGSDLIVDGAITANKIAANAIAVGSAAIQNGAIVNAMIGNLAVDDAKISGLAVSKLTAGSLSVGQFIRSTSYVAGTSGWTINADGSSEFSAASIRGLLTASQIDSRGLSIKDGSGNVILAAGSPLAAANITPAAGWLNSNVASSNANLLLSPHNFGLFNFSNATLGASGLSDPQGGTLATRLTLTSINADLYRPISGLVVGGTYRVSLYVYLETASNFCLVPNNQAAWDTGQGSLVTGSGWKRIEARITTSTGGINIHIGAHANSDIAQQTAGNVLVAFLQVVETTAVENALLTPSIASAATTANWPNVTGSGKPQDNATVGATFGVNIGGQITAANASTFIANAAIQTAQIANAAITNALIGTAAVQTANIADGNITTAKIADASIATAKIGDLQISTAKIGDNAVTTAVYTSSNGFQRFWINMNPAGIEDTFSSASISVTSGEILLLTASWRFNGTYNDGDIISVTPRLYFNGSVVRTGVTEILPESTFINKTYTLQAVVTAASTGSLTFSLTGQITNTFGGGSTGNYRYTDITLSAFLRRK
jgi:hypothetical protein